MRGWGSLEDASNKKKTLFSVPIIVLATWFNASSGVDRASVVGLVTPWAIAEQVCGHGSSPPTSRNGNKLSGDNILLSRLIAMQRAVGTAAA